MKRRDFLKAAGMAILGAGVAPSAVVRAASNLPSTAGSAPPVADRDIRDYLDKMHHFNTPHPEDVRLKRPQFRLLVESLNRLNRLQKTVGHGNFYLLNFDEALSIARNYPSVGRFTEAELQFLEMIFYQDGSLYGFLGDKPFKNLTDRIRRRQVVKVRHTGNYLYRGKPLETYQKIQRLIGDEAVLTSGVRSVIKQFMLFLGKAKESNGNLSMASRSLAPPGYSYHGVGDFDVGQAGFGADNFTERFATTRVFRKLKENGFLSLRYRRDNLVGVRFEPWHIKVEPQT
jgi:D-alanyl-D-alanine carboxypeptidase